MISVTDSCLIIEYPEARRFARRHDVRGGGLQLGVVGELAVDEQALDEVGVLHVERPVIAEELAVALDDGGRAVLGAGQACGILGCRKKDQEGGDADDDEHDDD